MRTAHALFMPRTLQLNSIRSLAAALRFLLFALSGTCCDQSMRVWAWAPERARCVRKEDRPAGKGGVLPICEWPFRRLGSLHLLAPQALKILPLSDSSEAPGSSYQRLLWPMAEQSENRLKLHR